MTKPIYLLYEDWRQNTTSEPYICGFALTKKEAQMWVNANEEERSYIKLDRRVGE